MNLTRRQFLKQTAAASAALALSSSLPLHANPMGEPLGFQTYEIFGHLAEDWDGTWKKMASYGYKTADYVEMDINPKLAGKTPLDVTRSFKANGLSCMSGTFLAPKFDSDYAGTVKYAHDLGLQVVIPIFARPDKTADFWKQASDKMNKLASRLKRDGLGVWYHNHEIEFVPVEGQVPYDILMANTDPSLIKFQIDVGNCTFGGGDAIAYLRKYSGRYVSMHCKDFVKGKASVPVGQGTLDWRTIFALAKQQNIRSYFAEVGAYGINSIDGQKLEQSNMDVLESFRLSAEFLKNINS